MNPPNRKTTEVSYAVKLVKADGTCAYVRLDNYAPSPWPHDESACVTLDDARALADRFVMQRARWCVANPVTKIQILRFDPTVVHEMDYDDPAFRK